MISDVQKGNLASPAFVKDKDIEVKTKSALSNQDLEHNLNILSTLLVDQKLKIDGSRLNIEDRWLSFFRRWKCGDGWEKSAVIIQETFDAALQISALAPPFVKAKESSPPFNLKTTLATAYKGLEILKQTYLNDKDVKGEGKFEELLKKYAPFCKEVSFEEVIKKRKVALAAVPKIVDQSVSATVIEKKPQNAPQQSLQAFVITPDVLNKPLKKATNAAVEKKKEESELDAVFSKIKLKKKQEEIKSSGDLKKAEPIAPSVQEKPALISKKEEQKPSHPANNVLKNDQGSYPVAKEKSFAVIKQSEDIDNRQAGQVKLSKQYPAFSFQEFYKQLNEKCLGRRSVDIDRQLEEKKKRWTVQNPCLFFPMLTNLAREELEKGEFFDEPAPMSNKERTPFSKKLFRHSISKEALDEQKNLQDRPKRSILEENPLLAGHLAGIRPKIAYDSDDASE